MSAITEIITIAKICPASFFKGSISRISSLIPMKNTMINPEIMYCSSNLKYAPAKITVDIISPIKTATPPSVGMVPACDDRQLGVSQRHFNREIFTIDGIVNHVMPNAIINPSMVSIQIGIERDEMLKGKATIPGFRSSIVQKVIKSQKSIINIFYC